jgi:hypothetical protein
MRVTGANKKLALARAVWEDCARGRLSPEEANRGKPLCAAERTTARRVGRLKRKPSPA